MRTSIRRILILFFTPGSAAAGSSPPWRAVVQQELGATGANCFDIMDACASWLRAVHVAHSLIHRGVYRRGLIVNCECGLMDYARLKLDSVADLESCFATYTIGEAATATVLTNDDEDDDFYFNFKTFGEDFDLCLIPLNAFESFLPTKNGKVYQAGKFFSMSTELVSSAVRRVVETFRADPKLQDGNYDIWFGHAASEKASEMVGRQLKLPPEIHYPTHRNYGNTVAASVPLAMSLATKDESLNRGDRVLLVIGSAGIAVALASFTF